MARRIFDLDTPDRFVTGTVGEPGNRTFLLQGRRGSTLVSVVLEKVQVQVLAERLAILLAELGRRGVRVPEALAPHDDDTVPLELPVVPAFRVGTLTIGWDSDREQVVLEARAQAEPDEDDDEDDDDEDDDQEDASGESDIDRITRILAERAAEVELVVADEAEDETEAEGDDEDEYDDDDPDGPDLVRVRLTPLRVRAFVERALRVVASGRPPCPLCGRPLDPGGHICPRRNGYVH
jgi:uncharacterized repeat protein (TIGR03847 family)